MRDGASGTFEAGWNDALERCFADVQVLKAGTASPDYIDGYNEAVIAVREFLREEGFIRD